MQKESLEQAPAWRAWLAENLARGVAARRLVESLAQAGVAVAVARAEVESAQAHPAVEAGRRLVRQREQQLSLLGVYTALHRHSGRHRRLERRANLSPQEFFARYYLANQPVVLQGLLAGSAALERWRPERLAERFGEVEVEVMAGRDADPEHDYNPEGCRTLLKLGEFIRRVLGGGATNDYYLTGRNLALERPQLQGLLEDLHLPPGYVRPSGGGSATKLWLGPAGTLTALHHDTSNVLFGQLHGRKRFHLAPSFELPLVYNHRSFWSEVDAERPDLERFACWRQVDVLEVELGPGDLLLIPTGWWHQVRALEVSVSVTFQRFELPGGNTHWRVP